MKTNHLDNNSQTPEGRLRNVELKQDIEPQRRKGRKDLNQKTETGGLSVRGRKAKCQRL